MILTEKQHELIERIGVALECKGHRPAAARILGLLFVAEEPHLSLEEIAEALLLSKSATSNALSTLLQTQLLEYCTLSGDRKRYFRLKLKNWQKCVLKQVEDVTSFSLLLRQVLEARTSSTPSFNVEIQELSSFMEYIATRMPQLLQEWKKEARLFA